MSHWQYPTPPGMPDARPLPPGYPRATARSFSPLTWWLHLTSTGWQHPPVNFAESELARRSRLASLLFLGLLITGGIFLTAGAGDIPTLLAILGGMLGVVIACILNRLGLVWGAGIIATLVLIAAVFGAVLSAPGGQLAPDYLPAYDILVLAVVVAGSLLTPSAAFYVAIVNSAAIAVDFLVLQSHSSDLTAEINQDGIGLLLGRPIGLEIAVAVVAFLWVSGTISAARRADRAEEVAALEHAYAEQRHQLEIGVQQILATHVRIANGDFGARAPLTQDNVLWQIAASLNNLLGRLQKAGQAEYRLQRTDEEIDRLVMALRDLQAQRRPIWPAPAGTSADKLLAVLAPPRLRQPNQPSQLGQRPAWEGLPGRQQWQQGPSWDSQGPSGPGAGTGGMSQFPSLEESRSWSEPPEWFGPGTGYGGGQSPSDPSSQSFFGQPPSSNPQMPQDPASAGPSYAPRWPSLDPLQPDNNEWSRHTSDAGPSPGDPFPSLDNPWYLPPDE
jgi:hypothetical protein